VGFLKRRAVALLIPFFCCVLLLNPVTNWLVWNWHNTPYLPFPDFLKHAWPGTLPSYKGPEVWHLHLWFLLSLSFYAWLAPAMTWLARALPRPTSGLVGWLAALPGWLCVMVVAALCAGTALALRVFYEIALEAYLPGKGWGVPWLVRTTFYYWPMFLTGMAVFHHAGLAARFHAISVPGLILGLAAVIISRETMVHDGLVWEVVQLLTRAFLTVCAIAALMTIFARWFDKPGFLSRSADAVYSIYILHFLVIYLLAWALRPLGLTQTAMFVCVIVPTVVALFALHRFVIRPSAVLSLMFNGKPLTARRAAQQVAKRQA